MPVVALVDCMQHVGSCASASAMHAALLLPLYYFTTLLHTCGGASASAMHAALLLPLYYFTTLLHTCGGASASAMHAALVFACALILLYYFTTHLWRRCAETRMRAHAY
jgi:hypothetical protein